MVCLKVKSRIKHSQDFQVSKAEHCPKHILPMSACLLPILYPATICTSSKWPTHTWPPTWCKRKHDQLGQAPSSIVPWSCSDAHVPFVGVFWSGLGSRLAGFFEDALTQLSIYMYHSLALVRVTQILMLAHNSCFHTYILRTDWLLAALYTLFLDSFHCNEIISIVYFLSVVIILWQIGVYFFPVATV